MTNYENPVQLLADLVAALDNTYWSSWQSTARFDAELIAARAYLDKQEPRHD